MRPAIAVERHFHTTPAECFQKLQYTKTNMMIKKFILPLLLLATVTAPLYAAYQPTKENMERRTEFEGFRFGIFIHWGIYSTFAQGEWYLNDGINKDEYAKAADAFYPHRFDASEWVRLIKESGAKYITFTSRHHDGFSMWNTAESDYNIVCATPFGRDVLKELSEACQEEGIRLHLYYSLLDWIREDYPIGRTGIRTGRTPHPDYESYFGFMKRQIHELLTQYGPIGALWFDGYWDHDSDSKNFDWRITELYNYAHSIRPELLIGNNHHLLPLEGEDFQMFERDLPGENTAGLSGQEISRLPLEMCQTMNGMWGYKVSDTNYKSTEELITLIVRAAGKGSNLLLNIGPQPNGELPAASIDRLRGIGAWLSQYGKSIYNTVAGPFSEKWGVSTQADNRIFLHVLDRAVTTISVALPKRPKSVYLLTGEKCGWQYDRKTKCLTLQLPEHADEVDSIVEIAI